MTIAETSTDRELLSRFVSTGEQAPFEELVARYAPLVLKVCRDVLGQSHDAEDAAQAVFLTLAQKASCLRNRATIAGWLHRVAWHVAMRAREARMLRRHRAREAAEMKDRNRKSPSDAEQIQLLVHGELESLPEKYRVPLILHHLEGHSEQETAALLGCKVGTVSGRLSRGRSLLRDKLVRRGVAAVSFAGLVAALSREATASTVAPAFVASTAKAATLVVAGQAAADAVFSAKAAALAQTAMKTLMVAKLKTAAAVLVATGLIVAGVSVTTYQAIARGSDTDDAHVLVAPAPTAPIAEQTSAKPKVPDDVVPPEDAESQPPTSPAPKEETPPPAVVPLKVPGLTCPINCPPKVKRALGELAGILDIEVDVPGKVVKCTVQPDKFEADEAITALAAAGYAGVSVQDD